jgi:AraC-like DNA-binding protein
MAEDADGGRLASRVFRFDQASLDSPIAARAWRTRSEPVPSFTSVAATHWEMVVLRQYGQVSLFVRGPETKSSLAAIPADAEFFGIEFNIGTFMHGFPIDTLVDGALVVPDAGSRTFWVRGSAWEFPTFDNADVFVRRLARRQIVMRDPVVERAVAGQATLSDRSIRRRVRATTGLTLGLIRQIERAQRSLSLLDTGASILDVVNEGGYADQSHLTRSLRRFAGHTPRQLQRELVNPPHAVRDS